jgi:hypothetical protein
MRDIGEQQFSRVASGDTKPNSWTLLDFGQCSVLFCNVFIVIGSTSFTSTTYAAKSCLLYIGVDRKCVDLTT